MQFHTIYGNFNFSGIFCQYRFLFFFVKFRGWCHKTHFRASILTFELQKPTKTKLYRIWGYDWGGGPTFHRHSKPLKNRFEKSVKISEICCNLLVNVQKNVLFGGLGAFKLFLHSQLSFKLLKNSQVLPSFRFQEVLCTW